MKNNNYKVRVRLKKKRYVLVKQVQYMLFTIFLLERFTVHICMLNVLRITHKKNKTQFSLLHISKTDLDMYFISTCVYFLDSHIYIHGTSFCVMLLWKRLFYKNYLNKQNQKQFTSMLSFFITIIITIIILQIWDFYLN